MIVPELRYVNSGGVHIAYRVFGGGPLDLVLVPAFTTNLEQNLEWPGLVDWVERLSSFARLIVFDKRGTGLSDRVPGPVVLEETMQDVIAVLDDAQVRRPAVYGEGEGGALSALFAATHPERTRALIMYAPLVKGTRTEDFPWALAPEVQEMFLQQVPTAWGSEPIARMMVDMLAPSLADDERFLQFMARALRSSVSPGGALAWLRMIADVDVREVLPQILVPTLILHRPADRAVDVGASRYAAARIPGAKLVELPGNDSLSFVGDSEAVAAEIEEFLTGSRPPPMPDRVLATILFTDIAGSTGHAAELGDRRWREMLERHDAPIQGASGPLPGPGGEADRRRDAGDVRRAGPGRGVRRDNRPGGFARSVSRSERRCTPARWSSGVTTSAGSGCTSPRGSWDWLGRTRCWCPAL